MKTALEELIEYIEEWQPRNKNTVEIWSKAKQLLFTERQQITNAYETDLASHTEFRNGSEYYNDIFNKNK